MRVVGQKIELKREGSPISDWRREPGVGWDRKINTEQKKERQRETQ